MGGAQTSSQPSFDKVSTTLFSPVLCRDARPLRQGLQPPSHHRRRPAAGLHYLHQKHLFVMVDLKEVIIHASRKGEVGVLEELMGLKVDVNTRDEKGYTPLIIACYNGKAAAAAYLLSMGAHVDAQDNGGNTALMGAAFKGYLEIAELLIRHGASLNLQHGNGGTALMFAAMFGRNEVLQLLLAQGADKSIRDARGLLAVDLARQQNNSEGALLLE